jgi:hypothetical protein
MTTWARIWTDGSADGRGPGGWAFVAVEAGHAQTEHSGGLPEGEAPSLDERMSIIRMYATGSRPASELPPNIRP